MSKPKRRRPYDASRRQLRALENQERVLEVARRLFAERGYAETTIDAIASEAGIAVPTVYAVFGSKRGVLDGLMKRLISGVPGGPPMLQTPGAREVLAEPDPRRALGLFIADLSRTQERVMPMYAVMKSAARAEPEIAEMLARMQQYRFANLEAVVKRFAELGVLRTTVDDASRTLWAIASPEVRELMTVQAGWSAERYRAWLEDLVATALLTTKRRSP